MSLPNSYIRYPNRRRGMDHDHFTWSNMFKRPPISWPDAKKVAVPVVISLEWFPIIAQDKPFKAPGHMQTPYPDFRHYSARDYGSRIGIYRLLDIFERRNLKVSVATNAKVAQRYPTLISDITAAGHEIIAHATDMNDTIATGLDEITEEKIVSESLSILTSATGVQPKGWLSIARSQSKATPSILSSLGFEYMMDWVNDELPYEFKTDNGSITNFPLNHELYDFHIMRTHAQGIKSFCEQITDAYELLEGEFDMFGGRIMSLHLTPYISGLPHCSQTLERMVDDILNRQTCWFAPVSDILRASRQYI